MFTWAVGREYLDRTPFRRGSETLIRLELEDNKRTRRVSGEEEEAILAAAAPHVRAMAIFALDTGARRGEMLEWEWRDVDPPRGIVTFRGATTKSGRTRAVPIGTQRLKAVLEWLRIDAAGKEKPGTARVFSNEVGEPVRYFRTAWKAACRRAGVEDLRWHDLRHEYASRLAERGVPLSQPDASSGATFKKVSSSADGAGDFEVVETAPSAGNSFNDQEIGDWLGVRDDFRNWLIRVA